MSMTPDQLRRKAEFDQLFDSMPGKNIERLRRIADILCVKENSVRIWRMKRPTRVIPDSKLRIIQRELARQAADGAGSEARVAGE